MCWLRPHMLRVGRIFMYQDGTAWCWVYGEAFSSSAILFSLSRSLGLAFVPCLEIVTARAWWAQTSCGPSRSPTRCIQRMEADGGDGGERKWRLPAFDWMPPQLSRPPHVRPERGPACTKMGNKYCAHQSLRVSKPPSSAPTRGTGASERADLQKTSAVVHAASVPVSLVPVLGRQLSFLH